MSSKWKTAVSNTISCFFSFASNLFSIWPRLMNNILAISFTFYKNDRTVSLHFVYTSNKGFYNVLSQI